MVHRDAAVCWCVMKKQRLVACLSLLFVASVATAVFAQTADAVVDKHLAAIGGRDALAKLTSRKSTGTVTLSTPQGDVSGPVELLIKAPNKSRVLMTIDLTRLGAASARIEQRFDGTAGYSSNSMQGEMPISAKQIERMLGVTYSDDDILQFVRNIYGVLLTRGILGTYVYVCDEHLRKHLRPFFSG